MLLPRSHVWTLPQKWLIVLAMVAGIVGFAAAVYIYERYHRGPDDTALVGTWRGEFVNVGSNFHPGYRFKPDHTFDEITTFPDEEFISGAGRWYAGGDFIYLRIPIEMDDGLQSRLEAWHIDAMTATDLQIHRDHETMALKRFK
jgi:hypothetical protein